MSTDMRGIFQESLFSKQVMMSVVVPEQSRYRVLASTLPWPELARVANAQRAKHVDLNNGRPLNLRSHLGAYTAQTMNGWTDRETEEMVKYHAGVRILCGLEESSDSMDRTSVETFRNMLGKEGGELLNQVIVQHASGAGFTGSELCAADTTVQESPIAYPTEVGHLKNISEKLVGIGKKLKKATALKLAELQQKAHDLVTKYRLFTRGKAEEVLKKKKDLSQKLHKVVKSMANLAAKNLGELKASTRIDLQEQISFFKHMLKQIDVWFKTGFHPKNKILSLWETTARSISKGKVGRSCEFGKRWVITRLLGGYIIGSPCQKLGADTDTSIADEVIISFLDTFGEIPQAVVYDRGGDSLKNEKFLKEVGVGDVCVFKKGKERMNVSEEVHAMARRERSLNESSIANIKHPKYNFTKPRARSSESCVLKGHTAILGFNVNNLLRDISQSWGMKLEIT